MCVHQYNTALFTTLELFPVTDKMAELLAREELDDACLRDSISIASTDSFVSAAEVSEATTQAHVHSPKIQNKQV